MVCFSHGLSPVAKVVSPLRGCAYISLSVDLATASRATIRCGLSNRIPIRTEPYTLHCRPDPCTHLTPSPRGRGNGHVHWSKVICHLRCALRAGHFWLQTDAAR